MRFPRIRMRFRPSRRAAGTAAAVIALGAVLVGGLSRASIETSVESFVPSSDAAVADLAELGKSFGGDPVVVLLESENGQAPLSTDRLMNLVRLEGQLSRLPDVAAVYGPGTILNQIAGRAQALLAELAGRREAIRAQAAEEARRGGQAERAAGEAGERAAAAFDARYGSLLVQGLPAGLPTLHNPAFPAAVVYDGSGSPRPQWRFVVPDEKSAAIVIRPRQGLGQEATEALVSAVRYLVDSAKLEATRTTVSGLPAVVSALGQQVRSELVVVGGVALVAVALCFLLVPWTSWRRRGLPVVATLLATAATVAVFGWAGRPLSLGVVAFLPVLLGVAGYYPTYFLQTRRPRAVCVVAAGTALSFAGLALSPLPFVRDLGLALAVGVVCACAAGLVLVRYWLRPAPVEETAVAAPTAARRGPVRVAAAVAGLAAMAGWAALPQMRLEADFQSLAAGLPAMSDAEHVQRVLRSSGEVDLVLAGGDVTSAPAMAWMRQAEDVVVSRHGDVLRPVTSPPTLLQFLGSAPDDTQVQAGLRLLPPYLVGAVIREDHKEAVLSYGANSNDVQKLRELRDSVLRELPPPPAGYEVRLTGLPMVAVAGYELVSADRYLANLAGVVAAGMVLAAGLRRRQDALRAVAAALLATGTGLFLLWLFGIPLNPVTVALGSLTAAVGCEFTVMLLEARRAGRRVLGRSVALAMATSACGYAALAVSGFAAMRAFGALLACSVVLSWLAAHLVVSLTAGRPPRPVCTRPQPERVLSLKGASR